MGSLRERNRSIWVATTPETSYPRLEEDLDVDVAVIGAGITGLTTALLLKRAGSTVAVIEAGRVASGVTGYTTAKVTSLHGLVYADMVNGHGKERALLYAVAAQAGIEQVAYFVEEGVECDFRRLPAFTYTEDRNRVGDVEAEVEASLQLGLPASFTNQTDLPYEVRAAVRFENQAMFHPRKYCIGLAGLIDGDGSRIVENTVAMDVDDGPRPSVKTRHGTVRAGHVVLATQLPFVDRGGFFAKTAPYRSYALAARLTRPRKACT